MAHPLLVCATLGLISQMIMVRVRCLLPLATISYSEYGLCYSSVAYPGNTARSPSRAESKIVRASLRLHLAKKRPLITSKKKRSTA